jgi:hypothetical protein
MITFNDIKSFYNVLKHIEIETPKEEQTAHAYVYIEQIKHNRTMIAARESETAYYIRYIDDQSVGEVGFKCLALYKEVISALEKLKEANTNKLTLEMKKAMLILSSDMKVDFEGNTTYNHRRTVRVYQGDYNDFVLEPPETDNLFATLTQQELNNMYTVVKEYSASTSGKEAIMLTTENGVLELFALGIQDPNGNLLYTAAAQVEEHKTVYIKSKVLEKYTKLTSDNGLVELYTNDLWLSGIGLSGNCTYTRLLNSEDNESLKNIYEIVRSVLFNSKEDEGEDIEEDSLNFYLLCTRTCNIIQLMNMLKAQEPYTTEIATQIVVFEDEEREVLLSCHIDNIPADMNEELSNYSSAKYDILFSSGQWHICGFFYKAIYGCLETLIAIIKSNKDTPYTVTWNQYFRKTNKGVYQWVLSISLLSKDNIKIITTAQDVLSKIEA